MTGGRGGHEPSADGPAMKGSGLHPQLPLGLQAGEVFRFETFVAGQNHLLVDVLRNMADTGEERQVFLFANAALGKSHLLQAACHRAAKRQRTVCYLGATQIRSFHDCDAGQLFDGLEQLDLICLDDLEQWLVSAHWQEALFDLINRVRERGGCLMLASGRAPEALPVGLADLRSRLRWGPVFQLRPLSDDDKKTVMQRRAKYNGLTLSEPVADYLFRHFSRDLADLLKRLEQLDRASMSLQRPLTIPLIKSVFDGD